MLGQPRTDLTTAALMKSPMTDELRAPEIRHDSRSRPSRSVPSQMRAFGGWHRPAAGQGTAPSCGSGPGSVDRRSTSTRSGGRATPGVQNSS
jgi:hypothetical protein